MQVYLDHNATTPLHESVKEVLTEAIPLYFNPSSAYAAGREVKLLIEEARKNCSALINADSDDIVFTSGGTESNNTVLNIGFINRLIEKYPNRNEIIVSSVEHPSVMNCAGALRRAGFSVRFAPVDAKGRVLIDAFESLLSERTALVSVMSANSESGTVQDINGLVRLAHRTGALFHTDAVQAVGKVPVDVIESDVDYLSCSGHKFYGNKGIGVLYIKKGVPFVPLIYGGNQEKGRRSGTENVLGIIGMGKAAERARIDFDDRIRKYLFLKTELLDGLMRFGDRVKINGDPDHCLPQTVNVSFVGIEAEVMQVYLDHRGIRVSVGSACSSGSPSYVLKAMGADEQTISGAVRFSLGIQNDKEQIDYVIDTLQKVIPEIK